LLLTAAAPAGVAVIAAATLAGAWLGWRSLRLPRLSLACAAMLLLVVVIADLLPDAWNDLSSTGLPWWPAAGALGAGFLATDALVRRGCACGTGQAGGRATTAVLGLHRALEGAALAVAGSVAVITALVLHAAPPVLTVFGGRGSAQDRNGRLAAAASQAAPRTQARSKPFMNVELVKGLSGARSGIVR